MSKFNEITSMSVSEKRTIVFSVTTASEKKVIIGQKMNAKDENNNNINFFLRGALNIPISNIIEFRDSINEVIRHLEYKNLL